ncbi:MAG TPA: ROK family transcriptional regulator [Vicinamibacterales bacterium]|nr:ROK family transcriptional regulator [Vicinamibacterales bacterium]
MRKIDLTNFQRATSGTARAINRRIALSFIRREAPLSRADLARSSGLQPSTVSAIIDELIKDGWVTEGMGRAPRGRRPRLLHLNVERAGIIAVDLRPETTTVGLAGMDARFVDQTSWRTPQDPQAWLQALTRSVRGFRTAHPRILCEGVGVSLPGRADAEGRLIFAPNLRWGPVNLRALIEQKLELPVAVENAANACALAELWFGRHPEHVRNLIAVTISEGIGVGLLMNGQLVRGGDARAGEFGHITLDENGPRCPCGKRGCWERYASNSAALTTYRDSVAAAGWKAPPFTFEQLVRMANEGDRHAAGALDSMATYVGIGLAGLITGLSPDVVVIVGEITAAWDRVGPIVADVVKRRALPPLATRIFPAQIAIQPRLRGAATLVVQQHFGAPAVA